MKILFFANTEWYLYNFRLSLAEALREKEYRVVFLSPPGEYGERLKAKGFQWLPFPLSRRGTNPLFELLTIWRISRLYKRERPRLVHHFTIKCVLYGSLAARWVGVKGVVNSITGLGYVFIDERLPARLIRFLVKGFYRLALKGTRVIFQNPDDQDLFLKLGLVRLEQCDLIRGSGVDTKRFFPRKKPEGLSVVMLVSRMLWDKGIGEFVSAAKVLNSAGIKARFVLVGRSDLGNPAAVSEEQIMIWQKDGLVEWWGWQDDMSQVYNQAHIVCLPSYREGMPRSLAEAAACGCPIVATDVPGCRELVRHGVNGLLVPDHNNLALADAIKLLIENPAVREQMGARGREIVENEFSTERVVADTLRVYNQILERKDFL